MVTSPLKLNLDTPTDIIKDYVGGFLPHRVIASATHDQVITEATP